MGREALDRGCDIFGFWVLIDRDIKNMGDITKLEVWELSRRFTVEVYNLTLTGKLERDFSYRDQIRRAAISVPSNIAEGEESGFDKMGVRYFYNAKASLAELKTQLLIASEINYISKEKYQQLSEKLDIISRKLRKLINYRKEYIKNQKSNSKITIQN